MISRRPDARFNRGRIATVAGIAGPPPPVTPLTILGSAAWWVRADLGITIATGVSAWADQSGNGVDFSQGTGAAQPAFIASAINGQPAVRGDGAGDVMAATWARASPSTQPFYIWLILKQVSFAAGRTIVGDYTAPNGFIFEQSGSSPDVRMYNVSAGSVTGGATVGSYARLEAQFTGSAADYIKAGAAAAVSGVNSGVLAGGGTLQLFKGGPSAGVASNVEIAEAFCFLGTPDAGQRAALDAYCTSRYGAGLV